MESIQLYKYRAFNEYNLDIICNEKIWYSSPNNLNDTFELQVPMGVNLSPLEIVRHCQQRYSIQHISPLLLDAMMEHGGANSIPVEKDFVSNFINTNIDNHFLWCVGGILFYHENGLNDEEIVSKLFPKDNVALVTKIKDELIEANQKNWEVGRKTGVLSLGTDCINPLMWAHYADSCKGFCIGFKYLLNEDNNGPSPVPVTYSDSFPIVLPGQYYNEDPQNIFRMIMNQFATKSSDWAYESEIRFFSKKADTLHSIPGDITEIIFGESMPQENIMEIVKAARNIKNKVSFYKITRNIECWGYRCIKVEIQ